MRKIKQTLRDHCESLSAGQYLPTRRFISQMIRGIALFRSPIITDIARAQSEVASSSNPRRLQHVVSRLSRHINSDRYDDELVLQNHLAIASQFTLRNDGEGIVIGVDRSDIAKPHSRPWLPKGMELTAEIHDGSKSKRIRGYNIAQIHASMPNGNQVPLVYEPYSYKSIGYLSQNRTFLDAIAKVEPYVGNKAIWTFDRGYDATEMFAGLDAMNLRFIIRMKIARTAAHPRKVMDSSGNVLAIHQMVDEIKTKFKNMIHSVGAGKRVAHRIGFRTIYIRDPGKQIKDARRSGSARTLVVARRGNKDTAPVALLCSDVVRTNKDALAMVKAYYRRWDAEEATRRIKARGGWGLDLEQIRVLKLRGVKRVVQLLNSLYLFLAILKDQQPKTFKKMVDAIKVDHDPKDFFYRAIRGLRRSLMATLTRRELYELFT